MPAPITPYAGILNGSLGFHDVYIGGTFVTCTSAQEDFLVGFDDTQPIPFGASRFWAPTNPDGTPYYFRKINIKPKPGALIGQMAFELIIGTGNYRDNRIGIIGGQSVRPASLSKMYGAPIVLTGGNDKARDFSQITTVAQRCNVRNKSAVNSVNLVFTTDDMEAAFSLTSGYSFELGPGENADFDGNPYYLWLRGTAGQSVVVSSYQYPTA